MARSKTKCWIYLNMFFVILIMYLIGSLYCEFKYLDFGYLIVVMVGFVRFLNVKERS